MAEEGFSWNIWIIQRKSWCICKTWSILILINYRKDTQNSTTLSHSTQHLCSDTFKSNLRHFHSRHQIFGISVNLKKIIFELVMKIVHYKENNINVYRILNKQQKWVVFNKTQTKHYCHSNGVRHWDFSSVVETIY